MGRRAKRPKVVIAAILAAFSISACNSGGGSPVSLPPPGTSEWFFVDNFSGDVSGFGASSGKLAPIPGSLAQFPIGLTAFAVEPGGTFLTAVGDSVNTGGFLAGRIVRVPAH